MSENPSSHPLSLQRRLVAYKTSQAWGQVPHAVYQYEPDATCFLEELGKLKESFGAKGIRLSVNTVLLKAIALALKESRVVHAYFTYEPPRPVW